MKKILALICVLFCMQTARADTESEMVAHSYCSTKCNFDYPPESEWTFSENSEYCTGGTPPVTLCSPARITDVGICFSSFTHSVSPATKAACDQARCYKVQEAMAEYVYCVNTYYTIIAPCPGDCCGYKMLDCDASNDCRRELSLAIAMADLEWINCMQGVTARVDEPSIEEIANAYLM